MQERLFPEQKPQHERRRKHLRHDRGERRALHAEPAAEDQDRVEHDVGHGSEHDGGHAVSGEALRSDEQVHPHAEHHKDGAGRVDAHIRQRIHDGLAACAEDPQKPFSKQLKRKRQHSGGCDQRGKAPAEIFLRPAVVSAAHLNGRQRRAALRDQDIKRGDDRNQRKAQSHAGQREPPDLRDMADVDAIDHIVEHIDDLCQHHRRGQPQQEPSDRRRAKLPVGLLFFHVFRSTSFCVFIKSIPYSGAFCHCRRTEIRFPFVSPQKALTKTARSYIISLAI